VPFREPVPLSAVGVGLISDVMVELVLLDNVGVANGADDSVAEGAGVCDSFPPSVCEGDGEGVELGGGSCLRTGCTRPAAATLKYRQRQRQANAHARNDLDNMVATAQALLLPEVCDGDPRGVEMGEGLVCMLGYSYDGGGGEDLKRTVQTLSPPEYIPE